MIRKIALTTLGVAAILSGPGGLTPAMAYDPCVRATQEYQEAERRLDNYRARHCPMACVVEGRYGQLSREWRNALDRMKEECR